MHPLYFHFEPPIIAASKQENTKLRAILTKIASMKTRFQIPHRWALYGWASIIALLLTYAVVGERGAIHLWRLQGEKSKLDEQNYRLQKENEALRQKIARLRNDDYFLEKIAREELNLARPGEVIYRFREPEQPRGKTKPRSPVPAQSTAK
jgi:cell division protein FtsB